MHRTIQTILNAQPAMDGAGVKINRLSLLRHGLSDPFLMLDELRSDDPQDFIAGFPPHPHRGMETLTYIRIGGLSHQDSMGNTGKITSGGVQWMSAGSGVIHSEMPLREHDRLHGFQLWINLPAKDKMKTPDYRDVSKNEIPLINIPGGEIYLAAGDWLINGNKISGPLNKLAANVHYADLQLSAGAHFEQEIPQEHQVVVFVYEGEITADKPVKKGQMALFNQQGKLSIKATQNSSMLILHGKALREPIASYGPFVMNTPDEIEIAIQEYQQGTLVR
jgi:quercetin 2,3-dioxygenase